MPEIDDTASDNMVDVSDSEEENDTTNRTNETPELLNRLNDTLKRQGRRQERVRGPSLTTPVARSISDQTWSVPGHGDHDRSNVHSTAARGNQSERERTPRSRVGNTLFDNEEQDNSNEREEKDKIETMKAKRLKKQIKTAIESADVALSNVNNKREDALSTVANISTVVKKIEEILKLFHNFFPLNEENEVEFITINNKNIDVAKTLESKLVRLNQEKIKLENKKRESDTFEAENRKSILQ